MIPAWIAGVEARWAQELLRAGQRDAATFHFTRAENDYRTALRLGFERALSRASWRSCTRSSASPRRPVAAFEAAEAADYLDAAAAVPIARAYVAPGRCPDVERITAKVERGLGVDGQPGNCG